MQGPGQKRSHPEAPEAGSTTQEEVVLDVIEQEVEEESMQGPQAGEGSHTDTHTGSHTSTETRRHEVRHEVALPPGQAETYVPLSEWKATREPARVYPFVLDPFQELATRCIDRGESVLVSAHTSAGKTVCAEYAIASALRDRQRVIYTSPIKALSNQKYRELQEAFGDVGLMTGDVTLNETASCLVMTTEILRSMLYRGSEVMREVAWVVFDEIHYMRDKERGVVWEETIILLPDTVHHVFLSATIPNALQFARWIAHLHRQPCHVVYTNYRPTPLQHYLFPRGDDGIHLVVDEHGVFREDNFQRALRVFGSGSGGGEGRGERALGSTGPQRRKGGGPAGTDLGRLLRMVMAKNLQPAIVFSFSKRECEANAMQLSRLDLNAPEEKRLVRGVFENALEALGAEDRALPQIESLLPLLERGIGIHHSGLLPLLKEVVEILFQEGLLKVLFATETFSIGLNMPAKTVVFTSARKFDGRDFRTVTSGEYIQMSGRAGRRGLDDRGIVIMMLDDKLEPGVCKDMIKGAADRLDSAFHLSYNMVLNLLRVDGMAPEFILERSFCQFQSADAVPELRAQLQRTEAQLAAASAQLDAPLAAQLAAYWDTKAQIGEARAALRRIVHHPAHALPFLQPGRLVRVCDDAAGDFGWAVVVSVQKHRQRYAKGAEGAVGAGGDGGGIATGTGTDIPPATDHSTEDPCGAYNVEVIARCAAPRNRLERPEPRPAQAQDAAVPLAFSVSLRCLDGLSTVRLHLPRDLRAPDQQAQLLRALDEVQRRFPDGVPQLDPGRDQGIRDPALAQLVARLEALERGLWQHPLHRAPRLAQLLAHEGARRALLRERDALERRIADAQAVLQMAELAQRRRVLRRLGYTAPADDAVIDVKGRVACEISTGDELLLTELIFSAAFSALSVDQTNALLSCFVFQERAGAPADDAPGRAPGATLRLRDELAGPLRIVQDAARRIWRVSQESGLAALSEAEYLAALCPELMDVVYAWSKGARFAKICRMTDVFEGSIIRCLRRLEELLRQLAQAARSIGNAELEQKFSDGMARIKRDIVFANSLYL